VIDCESVLGCPDGEELPCEEIATKFFSFEGRFISCQVAACDQHARLFDDGEPISEQEYAIFKIHED